MKLYPYLVTRGAILLALALFFACSDYNEKPQEILTRVAMPDTALATKLINEALEIKNSQNLNQWPELIANCKQAAQIYLQAKDYSRYMYAISQAGIRSADLELYEPMINLLLPALDTAKKYKIEFGDPGLVAAYVGIAIAYSETGRFKSASDYIDTAKQNLNYVKNKIIKKNYSLVINNSAGIIYQRLNDFDKSKNTFMCMFRCSNNAYMQIPIAINLGSLYEENGLYDSSLYYLDFILSKWEIIGNYPEKTRDLADVFFNKSITLQKMGLINPALQNLEKCYELLKPIFPENSIVMSRVYQQKGRLANLLGRKKEALDLFQKALSAESYSSDGIISEYKNPDINEISGSLRSLSILMDKARLLEHLGDADTLYLRKSFDTYILAKNLIDRVRAGYYTENDGAFDLVDSALSVYEGLVNTSWKLSVSSFKEVGSSFLLGKENKSFIDILWNTADPAKMGILSESVKSGYISKYSDIPKEISEKENYISRELYDTKNELIDALKTINDKNDSTIVALSRKEEDLMQRYDSLLNEYQHNYPSYYTLKFAPRPNIEEIQKNTLKPKQALIEYFLTSKHIFSIVVTNTNFFVFRRNLPSNFISMIDSVQYVMKCGFDINRTDFLRKYARPANNLYRLLLEDVLEILPTNINRLLIIPEGPINAINFDVLLSKLPETVDIGYAELPYLIKDYAISYEYSATFAFQKTIAEQLNYSSKTFKYKFGAFAQKRAPSNNSSNQCTVRSDSSNLVFAWEEVRLARDLFGGKIWSAEEATKENFLEVATKCKVLHIALHGILNEDNPMDSYLLFGTQNLEGNRLKTSEIYSTRFESEMVVLSACNTGIGKLQTGEGLLSISRAFAYSGIPSMLVSTWSLPDLSTSKVIQVFYKEYKKGIPKDVALRKAKLTYLLKNHSELSPFYWAGMIHIGDTKSYNTRFDLFYYVLIIIGIVLIALIYFLHVKNQIAAKKIISNV